MKERPILFSGEMVKAILAGQKTMTRRLVKPQPKDRLAAHFEDSTEWYVDGEWNNTIRCPYGVPGDRLWVRETFEHVGHGPGFGLRVRYSSDGAERAWAEPPVPAVREDRWRPLLFRSRPSIHMPRWASRIDLEVTGVRVERLREITEADAWAEGIEAVDGALDDADITVAAKVNGWTIEDARASFAVLWDKINGDRAPWASNPWVWVVSFKRVTPTGAGGAR